MVQAHEARSSHAIIIIWRSRLRVRLQLQCSSRPPSSIDDSLVPSDCHVRRWASSWAIAARCSSSCAILSRLQPFFAGTGGKLHWQCMVGAAGSKRSSWSGFISSQFLLYCANHLPRTFTCGSQAMAPTRALRRQTEEQRSHAIARAGRYTFVRRPISAIC